MDYTSKIAVGMTHEAVDTVTDANTAVRSAAARLRCMRPPRWRR